MNITIPCGTYYLGDPFHVLDEKDYIGIWGNVHNFSIGALKINGYDFLSYSTKNGDGIYYDTKDRKYIVETGIIALLDYDLINDKTKYIGKGHIFKFNEEVNFIYDIGNFMIKSGKKYIKINTGSDDEYDSDNEDENCLNDDNENISKTLLGDSDNDFIFSEGENEDDEDEDDETHQKVDNSIGNQSKFKFFK